MSRNEAEQLFDSMVLAAMDEPWDVPPTALVSPDGIREGVGTWRVLHRCPSRDTHSTGDGSLYCDGCGQRFTYTATGLRENRE